MKQGEVNNIICKLKIILIIVSNLLSSNSIVIHRFIIICIDNKIFINVLLYI